ncbi:response regulator transcription factor [Kribbella albertanoniae]|uniref:Response regulator transcription factor n=1 Tax=Kribbella albertanoniae TaxID=1266829 RepID=A0A4R4PNU5_9ACTN|nr:response regulator transcription factor [Kribbella albertanoniae]
MVAEPTRIVIADDQGRVRMGYRLILDAQPDMQVVGEAVDGADALRLVHRHRPDLVIADIRMPPPDGLELTQILTGPEFGAAVRVIVVTTFEVDEYVHAALRNGASGFLLKRSGPTLLIEAVRAAMSGDTLISPQVTVRLLEQLRGPAVRRGSAVPLTRREEEVASLVARGLSNGDIAAELFISTGTVKTHVASIQRKVGAANRVGIAAWAWESGQVQRSS